MERWKVEDGGLMEDDGRGTICIAFQAKRECCGSHTPGLHPGLLTLRYMASSRRTVSRWRLANRRRRRRRYRPQPTVTGGDVARNVSTEIAAKTQKKGANLVEIDS